MLPRITIGRLMGVVAAAAVLFAVARLDSPCTPLAPVLAFLYLCGVLGGCAARWRGRRWRTGLLLGLLLGPLGVILACSNPVPGPRDRGGLTSRERPGPRETEV